MHASSALSYTFIKSIFQVNNEEDERRPTNHVKCPKKVVNNEEDEHRPTSHVE